MKNPMAGTATKLLVTIIILGNSLLVADGASAELGHDCNDGTLHTYVNQSAFNENQAAVFTDLASNISKTSSLFATSISNHGKTDPVYGLVQCRNYLTPDECLECYTDAKNALQKYCPTSNDARIHLDGCFLRYKNTSFFEQGVDSKSSNYCASIFNTQPTEFSRTEQALGIQLIANASENKGYAVGSSGYIYALAQCWQSLSKSTCQDCLNDAQAILLQDCVPRQDGRAMLAGCFMRYATNSFYPNDIVTSASSPDLPPANSNKGKSKILPILLGSMGGAALIVVLCIFLNYRRSHKRLKRFFQGHLQTERHLVASETFEQVVFDYEVLKQATSNFDNKNMIGKGGFGEVYKGRLVDGRDIAVKKLIGRSSTQAMDEFVREVKVISSVRHRNLVCLLGCCTRGHDRLLVYEFMSNTSLDKHLFGDTGSPLNWGTRFNIIVGIARGLAYLHQDSNIRIIHRDIKCGNILLDHKFHPKIADFGLAKFFPEGETQASTRVRGTIGYTAPEYAVHGQLTEKVDVYGYGVVVLEIISGRKCIDTKLPEPLQLMLEWVWRKYESNKVLEIVDLRLMEEYPSEQMLRVIMIALLCTQASSTLRPTMSQVVSMLTNNLKILDRPTRPAFIGEGNMNVNVNATAPTSTSSHSDASSSLSLLPRPAFIGEGNMNVNVNATAPTSSSSHSDASSSLSLLPQ